MLPVFSRGQVSNGFIYGNSLMNPYKVLGLDESATQEQIKNAYRTQSKKHHPDTGGDQKEFVNIKKAYEILSNKETRDTYDLYGVSVDFLKEAKDLAFAVFFEVSDKLEEGIPIDREIMRFITFEHIPKFEHEMKVLEEKKIRLQKRLLRIIEKPEDDFITATSMNVLDRYTTDYKLAMLKRDLHKKALELLTEYKFDRVQISDSPRDIRKIFVDMVDANEMRDAFLGNLESFYSGQRSKSKRGFTSV